MCDFCRAPIRNRCDNVGIFEQSEETHLFVIREDLSEDPVCKRSCGEHVPEKRHREVLQKGSDPDGGKLRKRCSRHNNVEKYGCRKTHCRAHDGDCAGLTQEQAYVRVVTFRITVSCGERSADPVPPETGKQNDKNTHVERFN